MAIFNTADILIPQGIDMTRWSCVACDQFTSEPEYWEKAEQLVGSAPSTLRLMLPEAYLETRDSESETKRIYAAMESCLERGLFRRLEDSFVYIERTLPSGAVRRGLLGAVDLESYDWAKGTKTPVRATEGTVESRLPPRVRVRLAAPLEMPHIMVFIDDPENAAIPTAAGGEPVYDFDLMLGGGHIKGYRVHGEHARRVSEAIDAVKSGEIRFAMGDGNHSLAAAKRCWEEKKRSLKEAELETHPARFALVELVNIHDEAVTFEPIHRVIFKINAAEFMKAAEGAFPRGNKGHEIIVVAGGEKKTLIVPGFTIGELIGEAELFCKSYISGHGGTLDYVHGDEEAAGMAKAHGCAALLLPRMEKDELFPSVAKSGPFPKKSFSIGHSRDKRYYLECRKIV
ncbi:MAG: DUF1015 domain-containing protein [Clostridia bacterium]|nr:DUF1015 domain-containing protein [Clostridia bacterium]